MPISPEQMRRYPGGSIRSEEWRLIRDGILLRAADRCEGSPAYPNCRAQNGKPHPVTGSKVVLTIGHLDQRPENDDPKNLKAWCQRCHLTYDARQHAENAALTRAEKRGQPDLYGRR